MKFEAGKTYMTRSICDYQCIVRVQVISRTPKTIRADIGASGVKTLKIGVNVAGVEFVRPWGRYSMAPIVDATDTKDLAYVAPRAIVAGVAL